MSAVKLKDCENVQEYASKIQGYVNDFKLCAESSTGTMPKSEHSYYPMQGIPKAAVPSVANGRLLYAMKFKPMYRRYMVEAMDSLAKHY